MDYQNSHGVRFKITFSGNKYTVKYYAPSRKWPHIYDAYMCTNDKERQEMFFILNNLHFCDSCQSKLMTYTDSATTCKKCTLMRSAISVRDENIMECPVCYQKILKIDGTKKELTCKHEMCLTCFRRMMQITGTTIRYNTVVPVATVKCPMCRNEAQYEYSSLRPILPV